MNDPQIMEQINFISLARGFSRVFWGLALTAVLLLSQAKVEVFSGVRAPAFFLGTVVTLWGLLTLLRAGRVSPAWNLRLSWAVVFVFLQLYFFPFVRWWKLMPYIAFYTANIGALVAAAIASLCMINMIAADYFRQMSLRAERLEARIYAGLVVLVMALPLFAAVCFSAGAAFRYQTIFMEELFDLMRRIPIWLFVVATIPYSLTLAILWKARDRSYQQFCREKKT